jgi:hypothetical protein
MSGIFTEEEKKEMKNLSGEQNELAKETREFNRKLQELSRRTAMLDLKISQNIRNASAAMQGAEENLSRFSTGKAINQEKEALYWLSEGKQGMEEMLEKLAGGEKKMGQPMSGFFQYPTGGGIYGVRFGQVELPSKDDYKPAKEFREEILKSLKEKFPEVYEGLIKEYYRRLTE